MPSPQVVACPFLPQPACYPPPCPPPSGPPPAGLVATPPPVMATTHMSRHSALHASQAHTSPSHGRPAAWPALGAPTRKAAARRAAWPARLATRSAPTNLPARHGEVAGWQRCAGSHTIPQTHPQTRARSHLLTMHTNQRRATPPTAPPPHPRTFLPLLCSPPGTVLPLSMVSSNDCYYCNNLSYQNLAGQVACRSCPSGTAIMAWGGTAASACKRYRAGDAPTVPAAPAVLGYAGSLCAPKPAAAGLPARPWS